MLFIIPNSELNSGSNPHKKVETTLSKIDEKEVGNCSSDKAPKLITEKSPVHCVEAADHTIISMDVAGFAVHQLNIEIDNQVLTVSGERTNRLGDTFTMSRSFALKANIYDTMNIQANLSGGVLDLTIAKRPELMLRKIPISTGSTVARSSKFEKEVVESGAHANDKNTELNKDAKSTGTALNDRKSDSSQAPINSVEQRGSEWEQISH